MEVSNRDRCVWSGTRIMMTCACEEASSTVATFKPAFVAFSHDLLPL